MGSLPERGRGLQPAPSRACAAASVRAAWTTSLRAPRALIALDDVALLHRGIRHGEEVVGEHPVEPRRPAARCRDEASRQLAGHLRAHHAELGIAAWRIPHLHGDPDRESVVLALERVPLMPQPELLGQRGPSGLPLLALEHEHVDAYKGDGDDDNDDDRGGIHVPPTVGRTVGLAHSSGGRA